MRALRPAIWFAAAVLGVAACNTSDPPDPTIPAVLRLVDGTPQTGAASMAAVAPLRVDVRNAAGDPVEGVTVEWAVATGGGSVSAASTTTSAQGLAVTTFTYAATSGQSTVTAAVPGLSGSPQTFTLTSVAGNPGQPGGNQ